MSMIRTRKAVGALVQHEGKMLLVRKVKMMDAKAGTTNIPPEWDFPKGGIKREEKDIKTALMRELSEELGTTQLIVENQLPNFSFDFSPEVAEKIGYNCQVTSMFLVSFTGDPNTLHPRDEEIDQIKFFSKTEAVAMATHENSRLYIDNYF